MLEMKSVLFPGSFRPFTRGHADIVARALGLFDQVIVAVGVNASKPQSDIDAVLAPVRALYADEPRVRVVSFSGLTADYARAEGVCCIVRGVRSMKDYEYERDMADINRQLSGLETVILFSRPEYGAISSSVVRELESYGADITPYLP